MNPKSFEHVTDYIAHGSCLTSEAFEFAYTPGKSAIIPQTFEDLEDLARCAFSVYRGVCPAESPYQMWSAVTALSWMDKYFPKANMALAPYGLESEIDEAVARLRAIFSDGLPPWTIASVVKQHAVKVKGLVQALAVLTLMAVDHSVKSMILGDFPDAGKWHIWAHKFHTETVNISAALAHHSRTAQKGASKRHEENHAMKAEVFSWLDCNFNPKVSKDKTAEAIAGKVVPIRFRAVRSWIDDWQKQRSASTV
jgi:hypothetical protein